jgi:SPP1 gp7 family putative phage head morphogenesis protein
MKRTARFDAEPITLIQARRLSRPKRIRRLPKPLKPLYPHAAERQYIRDLSAYVKRAKELTREILFPLLRRLITEVKNAMPDRVRQDDVIDDLTEILQRIRERLGFEFSDSILATIANRLGVSIEDIIAANSRRLKDQYEPYGINIGLGANSNQLRSLLQIKIRENVQLIKTLSDRHFASLESQVLSAITQGKRVEDIEDVIDERFSSMESNAELIARDQVGKINGQLTEITYVGLGLNRYRWRGVGDERERSSHLALEGEIFSWDEPPIVDGEAVHPGEAIQCRCFAEPVMEDLIS